MIPSLLKDRIGPRALTALLAATIVMAGSSAAAAAPTDPPPGASPPPPSAQGPVQAAVGGTTNDYPGVSFASGVLVKAYLACSSGGYIVRSMQVYNLPAGDVSIKWAHYSGPPGAAADLNTPWFSLAKDSYYDDYYVTARGWYDNVIGIGVSVNGGPWEIKFSQMYATSKLADGSEQAQLGFCFIDN